MADNDNSGESDREVEAFFDGDCPVCSGEVEWLRRYDCYGRIQFVDIAERGFDPDRDAGMPIDRSTDCLQARLRTGEVLEGVEAIRHLYAVADADRTEQSRRPSVLSPVLELGHRVIAQRRLQRVCDRMASSCVCLRKAG